MISDAPSPSEYLKAILVEEIGLSEKAVARLIEEHDELDVQRHAMYCLWMMDQGKSAHSSSLVDCIAQRRLERAARNAKRSVADGVAVPRG